MSYDKASPNNKPMFTHVDLSWAVHRFLVSRVEFRRSTRNFWRVKTTHERFFFRVKTGYFRIFMRQNLGLRVKREPKSSIKEWNFPSAIGWISCITATPYRYSNYRQCYCLKKIEFPKYISHYGLLLGPLHSNIYTNQGSVYWFRRTR